MTLVEHLSELRLRIVISLGAIAIGTAIGFYLSPQVIDILRAPIASTGEPLRFISLAGAFFVRLKIAVLIGIALAAPIVLYQLWAFVSPGLTARERTIT